MKHSNLTKKVLYSLASFLWISSLSASIPMKDSPHRCVDKGEKNITPVDDLLPAHSKEGRDTREAVEKFSKIPLKSILQSTVDHLYTYHDLCGRPVNGMGGWLDEIGIGLCERLAAFDLTHEKILSEMSSSVVSSDLTFLRTVYQACRKSTNRYWNHPSIVHVTYEPTHKEFTFINKAMGKDHWTY